MAIVYKPYPYAFLFFLLFCRVYLFPETKVNQK